MRHKPAVKLSRSLGTPLTPKAAQVMEVRSYRPGQHGRARHTVSEYGRRLREKQLLRAQYFVSERYLRRAFAEAARSSGPTGENLLASLERRLDATVLRSGFARTIYQARQLVSHGHVLVDGRRVDIASAAVDLGAVVSIKPSSVEMPVFIAAREGAHASDPPKYLEVQRSELRAVHLRPAQREEIPVICDEQLVVEYYAR